MTKIYYLLKKSFDFKNKKNKNREKNKKYQFSNDYKHKLKFQDHIKKHTTSAKQKIIKIKNKI